MRTPCTPAARNTSAADFGQGMEALVGVAPLGEARHARLALPEPGAGLRDVGGLRTRESAPGRVDRRRPRLCTLEDDRGRCKKYLLGDEPVLRNRRR